MNWLNDVSATALKTITGCVLAVVLTVYFCMASYAGKTIDPILFGEMCVFAATIMGIAYAGFSKQRITDYGYVEAKGRADAQVAAAAVTPEPAPGAGLDPHSGSGAVRGLGVRPGIEGA